MAWLQGLTSRYVRAWSGRPEDGGRGEGGGGCRRLSVRLSWGPSAPSLDVIDIEKGTVDADAVPGVQPS